MTTTATATIDYARVEAFVHQVFGNLTGYVVTTMAAIGDELGLFKDLAQRGPANSEELAQRTGTNERYVREWLGAMSAAGYLLYDPVARRFSLPAEHVPALAHENGPAFLGGVHQLMLGFHEITDQLIEAFRHGGGVPQSAYPERTFDGTERFFNAWFENLLVQQWIPLMPHVQAKLEQGCDVSDIRCQRGLALIKLAQAYPRSRFIGYDVYGPNIARAISYAEQAGVADRVRFQQIDPSESIPGQYDLILTFDELHHAVDPLALLRSVRQALRPDGSYLVLEPQCADTLEGNLHPMGAFSYSASLLYCMTISLAIGGAGLGACGLPDSRFREYCRQAGFSKVELLPNPHAMNRLYEARP